MQINVAFGASEDWLKHAAVTATSVLKNSSPADSYKFYIMSDCFLQGDKELFLKLKNLREAEFVFIEMDGSYFEGAIHDPNGVSPLYRLRLPSLTNEDKILYMDSDLIALKNIAELYSTDVSDYYYAGVEDKYSSLMQDRIGLKREETYFFSGVLLMNLKRFREEKTEDVIMNLLRKHSNYTDQDALNVACRKAILSLPLKYLTVEIGYRDRKEEHMEALNDPVIFHFMGRPWEQCKIFRKEYWEKYEEIFNSL